MKRILFLLALFFPISVLAEDITSTSKITIDNNVSAKINDKNENTFVTVNKEAIIKITSDEEIHGIYIIYEQKSINGNIFNEIKSAKIAKNGFLHEYINIEKNIGPSKEVSIKYDDTVKIGEIYVLSKGELPDYVEKWDEPCEEADLLLFSTHSDDEQLFFAGLMPHYINKGAKVQVVYFTNHNDNPKRLHEQIHGLYTVGIRNYPIIGFIPDAWSDNLNWALKNLEKAGYSEEDAIRFEVEMIRRFKPLVVVGHDELGEYSHGQHILNTHVLKKALELANDSEYDSESYKNFGLWDTPKTYLHLYKENKIIMNYDEPLELFNGKTAYEVSKEGYSKHLTQQYTWFTKWLTGINSSGVGTPYKTASQIKKYSPCEFGLYKTTVGQDVNKNDMFENLTLRKDEKKEKIDNNAKEKIDNSEKNTSKSSNFKIDKKVYYIIGITMLLALILFIPKKK